MTELSQQLPLRDILTIIPIALSATDTLVKSIAPPITVMQQPCCGATTGKSLVKRMFY